jgi:SAM-dependent methyltransferase
MTENFTEDDYIAALIELHEGVEFKGPGDKDYSWKLMASLPGLPPKPRVADLGCGSGVITLLLATHFGGTVKAVDLSADFIEELRRDLAAAGLGDRVEAICADMGALDWPPASLDLIWSEGAAYNLGFERALTLWRPLLAPGGLAVISELSWFSDRRPAPVLEYWQAAYPLMGSEAENRAHAERAGFEVLDIRRLPAEAWWRNYYDPLKARMEQVERTPAMAAVIEETNAEIDLFRRFSDDYGYSFYVLRAA